MLPPSLSLVAEKPKRERRTPEQMQAVASFVDRLFEQSGYRTWTAFAKAANVNWQSLSDWHTGKVEPGGWGLIQLMASVSPDAVLAALGATADARVQAVRSDPQATLEGSVAVLLAWQPTVAAELDELRSRLEQLESARAESQAGAGNG